MPDEVLRRAVAARLFVCACVVAACTPALDGGPIVIAPTVAASSIAVDTSDASTAPASTSSAHAMPDVAGRWREEFDGRSGCADMATMSYVGSELHVDTENCEDGVAYEIDEVTFDGKELRFRLRVPKIEWVLDYHLTRSGDDTFLGTAEPPGGDPHTVRWVRVRERQGERDADAPARSPTPPQPP